MWLWCPLVAFFYMCSPLHLHQSFAMVFLPSPSATSFLLCSCLFRVFVFFFFFAISFSLYIQAIHHFPSLSRRLSLSRPFRPSFDFSIGSAVSCHLAVVHWSIRPSIFGQPLVRSLLFGMSGNSCPIVVRTTSLFSHRYLWPLYLSDPSGHRHSGHSSRNCRIVGHSSRSSADPQAVVCLLFVVHSDHLSVSRALSVPPAAPATIWLPRPLRPMSGYSGLVRLFWPVFGLHCTFLHHLSMATFLFLFECFCPSNYVRQVVGGPTASVRPSYSMAVVSWQLSRNRFIYLLLLLVFFLLLPPPFVRLSPLYPAASIPYERLFGRYRQLSGLLCPVHDHPAICK